MASLVSRYVNFGEEGRVLMREQIKLAHGKSIQVGSIKGSKRLFDVNDGMVLTGLIGELGLDSSAVGSPYRNGFITRLGLLQAPDLRKTSKIFLSLCSTF